MGHLNPQREIGMENKIAEKKQVLDVNGKVTLSSRNQCTFMSPNV
jgi:hypothetical protein